MIILGQHDAFTAHIGYEWTSGPNGNNLHRNVIFRNDTTLSGEPIDGDDARRCQRWELIYEITQIKGDGEAHPLLLPNDGFADYGTWDKGSFGPEPKSKDLLP